MIDEVEHHKDEVELIFERIAMGQWIEGPHTESISGPGSTINYTKSFRNALERFLVGSNCRSMFDAPCGDFNWMREVRFPPGSRYFGADIVSEIVVANQARYSSPDRHFMKLNIIKDPMPDADIWLCRDCLFHLSLEHVKAVLNNSLRSNFKYYMITSHFNHHNQDIGTGGFRELNLQIEPFSLPKPIAGFLDYVEGFPPRQVGLWTRDQMLGALLSDHSTWPER